MERGAAIANASERYLKKLDKQLVQELQTFKDEYKWLRDQKTLFVEEQWGLNDKWEPVAWNDWTNCWSRVKIDIGWQTDDGGVHIRDGKTGKFRPEKNAEYLMQLDLYSAAAVSYFPNATYVEVALWYTDQDTQFPEQPLEISADEARGKQKEWDKRVKKMLAEKRFDPTPSSACQWCAFSKSRGGPCKY
jgi:hypothetical protein